MKKNILSLVLLVTACTMTLFATPVTTEPAQAVTKASILQTEILPYLESENTEYLLQSLEEVLARAVNPDPSALPVTIDTVPLWADTEGLLLKGSNVSVDGSNNVTGINDLTVAGTLHGNLTGDVTGNLTGDVTGNLTGDVTGYVTGTADSAHSFLDALVGDVTGYQDATVVSNVPGSATVNGKTATAVAEATQKVEEATWDPTNGTLVQRDPDNGSFSATKILITSTPSGDTDAATKAYVDLSVSMGLSPIGSAIAYSNVNLSPLSGLGHTVDGIALDTAGLRVLLNQQDDQLENGVWVTADGAWLRPADYATGQNAVGSYVLITDGNTYAGSSWIATSVDDACTVVDTCSIIFQQFTTPGQTTGANVGGKMGVFKNKEGITLNFKTLDVENGLQMTNGGDVLTIATDVAGTMTAAHITATNSFYGSLKGNVTGNVTGASSANVLKAGDTMTGALTVGGTGLRAPNGTAAAPAYSFSGDTNTGIYRTDTADTLAFATGGAERMSISNNNTTLNNGLVLKTVEYVGTGHTIGNDVSVADFKSHTGGVIYLPDNVPDGKLIYVSVQNTGLNTLTYVIRRSDGTTQYSTSLGPYAGNLVLFIKVPNLSVAPDSPRWMRIRLI